MARVRDLWLTADGRKTDRHPDKGGGRRQKRWLACWDKPDGTEGTKVFAKKATAISYAEAQEREGMRGTQDVDPERGLMTVREYGETVFMPAILHLRPNSVDTYQSHLKNHIYPLLGKKRMSAVRRSDVQAWVAALARTLAPSTTETVYAVLRAMMQHAADEDPPVIAVTPCRNTKLPKIRKRVVEPLPAEAIIALLVAITPRYRVTVALGAGLGLREGEAFGLLDSRVERPHKRARIISQAQRGELDAELKTEASTRTIPADDWVLTEIDNHIRRYGLGPGGNIVTNRLGRVAQRNTFGKCWREAVANARTCLKPPAEPKAGGQCGEQPCADPAHCLPKGTRFRDLRHFYASVLIAANLNPKVIQARLGHATIAETMDTYTCSRTQKNSAAGPSTRPSPGTSTTRSPNPAGQQEPIGTGTTAGRPRVSAFPPPQPLPDGHATGLRQSESPRSKHDTTRPAENISLKVWRNTSGTNAKTAHKTAGQRHRKG